MKNLKWVYVYVISLLLPLHAMDNAALCETLDNAVIESNYLTIDRIMPFFNNDPDKAIYVQSLLMNAIYYADLRLARLALKHGADVNEYGSFSWATQKFLPLRYALEFFQPMYKDDDAKMQKLKKKMNDNSRAIIDVLMKADADPTLVDMSKGLNALQFLDVQMRQAIVQKDQAKISYFKDLKKVFKQE